MAKGGLGALVQYPAMKSVPYVDWPELPGVYPDLSQPRLEAKGDINISFFMRADRSAFLNGTIGATQAIEFSEIGYAVPLRFKRINSRVCSGSLELFSASFTQDAVSVQQLASFSNAQTIATPNATLGLPITGLTIDGMDCKYMDILPTKGAGTAITTAPPNKDNLIIDSDSIDGQLYPDTAIVKDCQSVSIPFLLRARTSAGFWRNYLYLLSVLASPGRHVLGWRGTSYDFYYQSQSVNSFWVYDDGYIWCQFTLNLMFIGNTLDNE